MVSLLGVLFSSGQILSNELAAKAWVLHLLFFPHKLIYIQPMDKGVKPTVACTVGIAEAKTVSSVLIQVKFHGPTCLVPGLDNSKLPLE